MPDEKHITAKELRLRHKENEKFEQDKHELLGFYLFRPVSFYPTAWLLKQGVSANQASWISIVILVLGCLMLAFGDHLIAITGAIFINIWIVLDFVDGNIARHRQSCSNYGEFLDALGALIAHMVFFALGIGVYLRRDYFLFSDNIDTFLGIGPESLIILGAWASLTAVWIRAVFQKFKNTFQNSTFHRYEIVEAGQPASLLRQTKIFINNIFDFSGLLLPILLLSVIFKFADVLVACMAILNTAILFYSLVNIIGHAANSD